MLLQSNAQGEIDEARVREVLLELASRPEFAPREKPPLEDLADRFFDWLGGVLRVPIVGGLDHPFFATLLLIALVVAGIALAVYLLRRRARRASRAPAQDVVLRTEDSTAAALAEADVFWSRGAGREALDALYRAALLALGARGLVLVAPSKLARTYSRELGHRPERADLERIVGALYPVAFGGRTASASNFSASRSAALRLAAERNDGEAAGKTPADNGLPSGAAR